MDQEDKALVDAAAEEVRARVETYCSDRINKIISQRFSLFEAKKPPRKPVQVKVVFTVPYKDHDVTMFEIVPDYHEVEDDIEALKQAAHILYSTSLRFPDLSELKPHRARLYGFEYRGYTVALMFTDVPVRGAGNFHGIPLEPWETIFLRAIKINNGDVRALFGQLTEMGSVARDNIATAFVTSVLAKMIQLGANSTFDTVVLPVVVLSAKRTLTYNINGDTTTLPHRALSYLTRLPAPKKEYKYH